MRILYLSLSYVPSRRASSVQVMKMCEALAHQGHDVTLITKHCTERQERGVDDDHAFYGVQPIFEIAKLPRPAWRGGGLLYRYHLWKCLRRNKSKTDLVFSRHLYGALRAARMGHRVLFEAHDPPIGSYQRIFHLLLQEANLQRLVTNSSALASILREQFPVPNQLSVIAAPNGAEIERATRSSESDSVLPGAGSFNVGYVGNLYAGRGVEVIVELASRLPNCNFHIVGGREKELEAWTAKTVTPNLHFHGFVPPALLGSYYRQFDVLLMPYQDKVSVASGNINTSSWMSPLKMFEYMATGKPVISSDLPVLREILTHEENALLVPATEVTAWEESILRLYQNRALGARLGVAAQHDVVTHYTWENRAMRVLEGLSHV